MFAETMTAAAATADGVHSAFRFDIRRTRVLAANEVKRFRQLHAEAFSLRRDGMLPGGADAIHAPGAEEFWCLEVGAHEEAGAGFVQALTPLPR